MKVSLLLTIVVAVSGCATQKLQPMVVSGETVLIQGAISQSTAAEFERIVSSHTVSRVLLASGGGLVEPTLAIAAEIRRRRLEVEVIGNCFSSCANYLFPARVKRTISGLGVVAWHGNMSHLLYMHAMGTKLLDGPGLTEVQRLERLERAFFELVGLDQFICWFGKIEPYKVRNLYFLDAEDMARFGLADVKVRADYAKTDTSSQNTNGAINLQYIKVNWSNLTRPTQAQ